MRGPRTRTVAARLFFSVSELASMANCSPYVMRGILRTNDVKITAGGQGTRRRGIVFTSSLATALPELVDSIRMREE